MTVDGSKCTQDQGGEDGRDDAGILKGWGGGGGGGGRGELERNSHFRVLLMAHMSIYIGTLSGHYNPPLKYQDTLYQDTYS